MKHSMVLEVDYIKDDGTGFPVFSHKFEIQCDTKEQIIVYLEDCRVRGRLYGKPDQLQEHVWEAITHKLIVLEDGRYMWVNNLYVTIKGLEVEIREPFKNWTSTRMPELIDDWLCDE